MSKRKNPQAARKTSSISPTASERKLNDLAIADNVALLENNIARAQEQLDAFKNSTATVGLRLNTRKNQPQGTTITKLVSDNQQIVVVDDFKSLRSYVGSTAKDVSARIALDFSNKFRPILKATRPTINFKFNYSMQHEYLCCLMEDTSVTG